MPLTPGSRRFKVGTGDRPWVATPGKADVRLLAGEVFEKLLARFMVPRRAYHGAAGDIHVRFPADRVGNDDADQICDGTILRSLRACQSHRAIGVGHGDFASSLAPALIWSILPLFARAIQVVDDAFELGLGFFISSRSSIDPNSGRLSGARFRSVQALSLFLASADSSWVSISSRLTPALR
jgi:hypothetical protein